MATKKHTIIVPVNFGNVSNLIDNNSTDIGTFTVYIPENSAGNPVTFTSVMMFFSFQNATGGSASNVVDYEAQLAIIPSGSSTVTSTGNIGNSGEQIAGIIGPLDYTSFFNSNFGTSTSRAFTAYLLINQSTGDSAGVYAYIEISYEYSDTASTRIQTVCVPYESNTGALPSSQTTFCTLSQLTSTGGILNGYSNVNIRHRWIEIKGNNGNTATSNRSLFYSFDSGGSQNLPTMYGALATCSWLFYQTDASSLSATSSHTFQLWCSTTSLFDCVVVNEWISFEYDISGTTEVLNYIELPFEMESPIGTSSASSSAFSREFLLPEPGTITTLNCAVEFNFNSDSSKTINLKGSGQASYRAYALVGGVVGGQFTTQHRLDSGSASGGSFSLSRGRNDIIINGYANSTASSMASNISGVIKLLYLSSVSSLGVDNHSRTIYSFVRENDLSVSDDREDAGVSFSIPSSDYWVQSFGFNYFGWFRTAIASMMVQASYETGEGPGSGWKELYNDLYRSDNETAFSSWYVRAIDAFKRYPNDNRANILDFSTSRTLRTVVATTSSTQFSNYGIKFVISYHTITFTISGTVSNSNGGTVYLDLYEEDGNGGYKYLKSTTRSGSGSYSFTAYDDTIQYYVVAYEDSTYKSVSKLDNPATNFNIDLAGGGGGSGEFYF